MGHQPGSGEAETGVTGVTGATGAIVVIGRCAASGCDRPARLHVELEVPGAVVRGPVCDRCARASELGAVLLRAGTRRLA